MKMTSAATRPPLEHEVDFDEQLHGDEGSVVESSPIKTSSVESSVVFVTAEELEDSVVGSSPVNDEFVDGSSPVDELGSAVGNPPVDG